MGLGGGCTTADSREIHQGPVCQTQRQIQIPEANVTVQTQNPLAAEGQSLSHASSKGCFACSALTGYDGNALSHVTASFPII